MPADALLRRLADHLGDTVPPRPERPGADRIDLRRADELLEPDDPGLRTALDRLLAAPNDPGALDRDLAEVLATADDRHPARIEWGTTPNELLKAWAAVHDGAAIELCLGAPAAPRSPGFERLSADQLAERLQADRAAVGCVTVELRAGPTDAERLEGLLWALRAARVPVCADERRTAFRLAPGTVRATLPAGIRPATTLLGASVAGGLPFAALLRDADAAPLEVGPPPSQVTRAVAWAQLTALADRPIHEACAAAGAMVRERLLQQAATDTVLLRLEGPDALPTVVFEGQENAEAPLIAHHFQLELAARGLDADADLVVPRDPQQAGRAAATLAEATARIRCLLIEHNSWLSGGVPWCFGSAGRAPEQVRTRGLARYRYPKPANVEIEPVPDADGMRIAFDAGELGPITSSGFYLPTRLVGDLEITVRYSVRTWEPGPDSACLGLFLQNEASSARYYAQLMTTSNRPAERSVAAGLEGGLTGRTTLEGDAREHGFLRVSRSGRRIAAWFRDPAEDSEWQLLDAVEQGTDDPLICGAKIWSKVRCGGLVVDLTGLTIDASPAEDQMPPLEPRPDPRSRQPD